MDPCYIWSQLQYQDFPLACKTCLCGGFPHGKLKYDIEKCFFVTVNDCPKINHVSNPPFKLSLKGLYHYLTFSFVFDFLGFKPSF